MTAISRRYRQDISVLLIVSMLFSVWFVATPNIAQASIWDTVKSVVSLDLEDDVHAVDAAVAQSSSVSTQEMQMLLAELKTERSNSKNLSQFVVCCLFQFIG